MPQQSLSRMKSEMAQTQSQSCSAFGGFLDDKVVSHESRFIGGPAELAKATSDESENLDGPEDESSPPQVQHLSKHPQAPSSDGGQDAVHKRDRPPEAWDPTEKLSKEERKYYLGILRALKRYLVMETKAASQEGAKEAMKEALQFKLNVPGVMEQKVFWEALVGHVIQHYPKYCNPDVPSGSIGMKKIVEFIHYLTSPDFHQKNSFAADVSLINTVVSEFCTSTAYPLPLTGKSTQHRTSRFKFLCLNDLLLSLNRKKLLTDLTAAQKALELPNMLDKDGGGGGGDGNDGPYLNHESVLIASRWIIQAADTGLHDYSDTTRNAWLSVHHKITLFEPQYVALKERNEPEYKKHLLAVRAAQHKMDIKFRETRRDSSASSPSVTQKAEGFVDVMTRLAKLDRAAADQSLPASYGSGHYRHFVKRYEEAVVLPERDRKDKLAELVNQVDPRLDALGMYVMIVEAAKEMQGFL